MKYYRINKRFVDRSGNVYEPQDIDNSTPEYYAKDTSGYKRIIFPEKLLHRRADWLEEVKPERWTPKGGDIYFFSDNVCMVSRTVMTDTYIHNARIKVGNAFKTYTECSGYIVKQIKLLSNYQDELMEVDNE